MSSAQTTSMNTDSINREENTAMYKYEKDMRQVEMLKSMMKDMKIEDRYLSPLGKCVREYLFEEGYAKMEATCSTKEPTEKGKQIGLYMEAGMSSKGEPFTSMVFGKKAQEQIAALIPAFIERIDNPAEGNFVQHRQKMTADYVYGTFYGKKVKFNRNFASHTFSDEEITRLLNGEVISVEYTDKNWVKRCNSGRLQLTRLNGNSYCTFVLSCFRDYNPHYGAGNVRNADYQLN